MRGKEKFSHSKEFSENVAVWQFRYINFTSPKGVERFPSLGFGSYCSVIVQRSTKETHFLDFCVGENNHSHSMLCNKPQDLLYETFWVLFCTPMSAALHFGQYNILIHFSGLVFRNVNHEAQSAPQRTTSNL